VQNSYDVAIVNFNGRNIIGKCLDSVYKSTILPRKVIIYDNGSRDGSAELLKKKYSQVDLIEGKTNIGFARGNNEALKRATSKFVFFINNDVVLDKNCAQALLAGFKDKKIVVLNPMIYRGWKIKKNQPVYAFGAVLDRCGFNYGLYDRGGDRNDLSCFSGAAFMARTGVIKEMKFEQRFFLYYEEPDLAVKIFKKGLQIGRVKRAECYHLESYSSPREIEGIAFRQFNSIQNKWYILGKYWPCLQLLGAFVVNGAHLLYIMYFMIKHLKLIYLKIFYLAPINMLTGLLHRGRTKTCDKAWFKRLDKAHPLKYLAIRQRVFAQK